MSVEEVKAVGADVEATWESSRPEGGTVCCRHSKKEAGCAHCRRHAALLLVGAVGVGSVFLFGWNTESEQEETIGCV